MRANQLLSQDHKDDDDAQDTDWKVDGKAPPPVRARQVSANNGAYCVGAPAGDGEEGPVFGILLEADFIGDDGSDKNRDAGAGNALKATAEQEDGVSRCRCTSAEDTANSHQDEDGLKRGMAAEDVGHLAPERNKGCAGKIERGHDPVELVDFICSAVSTKPSSFVVVGMVSPKSLATAETALATL